MNTEPQTSLEDLRKIFAIGLDLFGYDEVKIGFTSQPTSHNSVFFQVENGSSFFELRTADYAQFYMGHRFGYPAPIKSKLQHCPMPFLKRGTRILFKISSPSLWTTTYHIEDLEKRIYSNTIIRVTKRSFKNGLMLGEPCVIGIFFQQNFIHDSKGKFENYRGGPNEEIVFKFQFEKREAYESHWMKIPDPRRSY